MEFLGEFFMAYDIDMHQLNLQKILILIFWMKLHSKNVLFCICLVMYA
jgi:hypothetical protein